jgi:large subunit ribosomal protein L25
MKVANMKAASRSAIGRNQTQHLRKEGWLPAIVYGEKKEPVPISISEWEFEQHIKQHHKVYSLEIEGTRQDAFLQTIHFDSLTDRPLHADFLRIDLNKPMEVDVEINLLGHPVGLGKGGSLLRDNMKIKIRCLPAAIPENIEVAIGHLDTGQSLLAKDLKLGEGVELAAAPDLPICRVTGTGDEEAPADEAPAE